MSKERLSRLQRAIIKTIQEMPSELTYRGLIRIVAEKMGKSSNPMFVFVGGQIMPDGFRSIFSQSVRNLEKKGLVWLEYHGGYSYDMSRQKVLRINLTEEGKTLNLNKNVKNKNVTRERTSTGTKVPMDKKVLGTKKT